MAGVSQTDGNQGIGPTPPVAPAAPTVARDPLKPQPAAPAAEPQGAVKDSSYQKGATIARGSIPATGLAADGQQHLRVPTRLLDSAFGTIKVHQAEDEQQTHPTLFQRLFGWVRRRR